jgi:glycosyltransferase involved in cell wall biosynthesis
MKIGVVSIYPNKQERYSYKGGVATYTKNLMEAIVSVDKNMKATVLAERDDEKISYYEKERKIKVIRSWQRGVFFYKDIIRSVIKENLNVIHLHQEFRLYGEIYTSFLFLYLLWRLKMMKVKSIVTIHGVLSSQAINKDFIKENNINFPPFLVKMAFGIVYRGIGKLADRIIVHDTLFKNFLVKDYKLKAEKILVIFLGVENLKNKISQNQARQTLGIKKKRVVLFFGYVTGYKSPDLLLKAFTHYAKFDKDCLLIFAGGKHPKMKEDKKYLEKYQSLEKLSRKINPDQIWWYGFVEEKDIEKVIMAADLLVFPYAVAISASGPLALGFSYKKPFLISETLKEMFDNQQIVFKNNPQSLSLKMKDFFGKKIKIDDFVQKEREKRLWTSIAKKTSDVYNSFNAVDKKR